MSQGGRPRKSIPAFQADLAALRSREALVRSRTQLVSHVRGTLKAYGIRLCKCSTASLHRQTPAAILDKLQPALEPVIRAIGGPTEQICAYDAAVETMATQRYPESAVLSRVAGLGPLTSVTYILTLEDPRRFLMSRTVGAYPGLTPRRDQSGRQDPQLRITKCGNGDLRRLLAQAAHYILGPFAPDTALRRWEVTSHGRDRKASTPRPGDCAPPLDPDGLTAQLDRVVDGSITTRWTPWCTELDESTHPQCEWKRADERWTRQKRPTHESGGGIWIRALWVMRAAKASTRSHAG